MAEKEGTQGQKKKGNEVIIQVSNPGAADPKPTEGLKKEEKDVQQVINPVGAAKQEQAEASKGHGNKGKEVAKQALGTAKQEQAEASKGHKNKGKGVVVQGAAKRAEATNLIQKNKGMEVAKAPNLPQRTLTLEQLLITASYNECARDFCSKKEMTKIMTERHGVTERSVGLVFDEMMKGKNAEAYLKESEKRSFERAAKASMDALIERFASSKAAEANPESDGASSSSSRGRGGRK